MIDVKPRISSPFRDGDTGQQALSVVAMFSWPRFIDHALNASGVLQWSLASRPSVLRKLGGPKAGRPAPIAVPLASGMAVTVQRLRPQAPEYGLTVIWALVAVVVANATAGSAVVAVAGVAGIAAVGWAITGQNRIDRPACSTGRRAVVGAAVRSGSAISTSPAARGESCTDAPTPTEDSAGPAACPAPGTRA